METDVTLRVLVVEPDDARYAHLSDALEALRSIDVHVERARDAEAAHEALRSSRVDVCLAPSKEGPDVSAALTLRLARAATFVPVIAVAENASAGVEAIRFEGATDYMIRDHLSPATVERALWVAQARRDAVEAFRHEQEVFSTALRNADIAAIELAPDGRVTRLSALAADAVGMDVRTVLGQRYTRCFSADQHDAVEAILSGAHSAEVSFRESEESDEVEWVFAPLSRGGAVGVGQFLRVNAVGEREAHRILRHVSDSIPMIVYATDANGEFTYVDGSALDLFGIAGGDLVGESVFELYGDREERIGYVRRALQGEPTDVQVAIRDRSFRTRYIPLVGNDDRVTGLVMVAYDNSGETESERRFQQLAYAIDAVDAAIGVSDVDGKVLHLNRAMIDRFGYTLEQMNDAGGSPAMYRNPSQAAHVFGAIRAGERWDGEVEFQTRTGETTRLHLQADAVFDDTGALIGLVSVHRELDTP